MEAHEDIRVVVAERGGDWAAHADAIDDVASLLILQQPEERIEEFTSRVREKLARVVAGGRRIVEAAVVGGGRTDVGAMSARSLMIRLLTSRMIASGGGQLSLIAAGPERLGMLGLATTVSPMLEGSGVELSALSQPAAASSAAA